MSTIENKPLVSVIIPYYNHGSFIDETLSSIKAQGYDEFEVIIIDDCSTDPFSKEKLNQLMDKSITLLRTVENSGPSVARNLGIAVAKGKYILPLDGDDKLDEVFLADAVSMLETNPEIMVCYGNGQLFGAKEEVLNVVDFEQFTFVSYNPLFVTALIRKEALEMVGYYDVFLSKLGLEDWDLWLGMGEKRFRFKKLQRSFLKIRVLEKSRTFEVANRNLDSIYPHIYTKHWQLLLEQYKAQAYRMTDLEKSREYKLGKLILQPIKKLAKLIKKN